MKTKKTVDTNLPAGSITIVGSGPLRLSPAACSVLARIAIRLEREREDAAERDGN